MVGGKTVSGTGLIRIGVWMGRIWKDHVKKWSQVIFSRGSDPMQPDKQMVWELSFVHIHPQWLLQACFLVEEHWVSPDSVTLEEVLFRPDLPRPLPTLQAVLICWALHQQASGSTNYLFGWKTPFTLRKCKTTFSQFVNTMFSFIDLFLLIKYISPLWILFTTVGCPPPPTPPNVSWCHDTRFQGNGLNMTTKKTGS